MTEELFLSDSYLREFEARVRGLSGREVVLDRSAFYPGGGGQPPDRGTLGIGPVRALSSTETFDNILFGLNVDPAIAVLVFRDT